MSAHSKLKPKRKVTSAQFKQAAHAACEDYDHSADVHAQAVTKASRALLDYVNDMSCTPQELVDDLSRSHRTLQQGVTRFCVAWLENCAKQYATRDYDLRNEASAELGRQFMLLVEPRSRAIPSI